MSANDFFEKYSIEEISKRTKISPISLRFIKNKEYEKIPRVKFLGFIKIIEREFKVDLSHLIEEFDAINPQKEPPAELQPKEIEKEEKKPLIWILAIITLLLAGGTILLINANKKTQETLQTTKETISQEKKQENNNTQKAVITPVQESNQTDLNTTANDKNESNSSQEQNISTALQTPINEAPVNETPKEEPKKIEKQQYPVTIIPKKKLWFKAVNLKTKKIISKITTRAITLPKGDYYIKFGHGLVKIKYASHTIDPKTKQIVKIVLKDGNYTYVKKQPKE